MVKFTESVLVSRQSFFNLCVVVISRCSARRGAAVKTTRTTKMTIGPWMKGARDLVHEPQYYGACHEPGV